MNADKVVVTDDERDAIVQQRFGELLQQLAKDTGMLPFGAIVIIAWPTRPESVSVATTIVGNATPLMQLRIIDMLSSKFAKAVSTIKSRINVVKA